MFINAEKLLIFNFWSSVFNPWLQKYMFLIQFLFKLKTIEPLWCEQQRSGVGPDTGVLLSSGHQILDIRLCDHRARRLKGRRSCFSNSDDTVKY